MDFEQINGQIPITDASGLIPGHINTQRELNEWEAANLLNAYNKYLSKKQSLKITIDLIKKIHHDMFNRTWEWAGKFRKDNSINMGIDFHQINENLKLLVDDIRYWQNNPDSFTILEQSVRIHYRLVKVHAFQNGNGRHARLVSDIFLFNNDHPLPDWPNKELVEKTDVRKKYISSLKSADNGDFSKLHIFTNSLISNQFIVRSHL